MSPWFSTAAVIGQLRDRWVLSSTEASWLTIAVQLGFVIGAFGSSLLRLADRLAPRRLILIGAAGAAAANALVPVVDAFGPAVVLRLVTGAALALVYPPALKAMSSWFVQGRGLALGIMIGALTVGSALPHLLNALVMVNWQTLLFGISAVTLVGGAIAELSTDDGPHTARAASFEWSQVRSILANPGFRLASLGYFGHMWELYAMWAWIAVFSREIFDSPRIASLAAFAVIAAGAGGSIRMGIVSDRISRATAAGRALRWSAAASLVTGFLVDVPWPLVMAVALVWGWWVVADSAQFSASVADHVDDRFVGTALTIQLATGFVLTVFTIFLVPVVRDAAGWGWAFAMLTPGPVVGALAMRGLERLSTGSR